MTEPAPCTRVMLWTTSRTLSTVLCRCIGDIDGVQIVCEAYKQAYFHGPDADTLPIPESYQAYRREAKLIEMDLPKAFKDEICSYEWVKTTLEGPFPNKSVVFGKDFVHCMRGRYDMLPRGYKHAFLIRHPHKVFISLKTMLIKILKMNPDSSFNDIPLVFRYPYSFQDLFELHQYIQDHEGYEAVVIDADDLQSHPRSILSQFCNLLGIPFSDSYLEWNNGDEYIKDWIVSEVTAKGNKLSRGGFFSGAFGSSRFDPPKPLPSRDEVPEDLLKIIDDNMQFYEKLYEKRLKPE